MQPAFIGHQIVNHRPHAIPIRAPPPERGSGAPRQETLPVYQHGIPCLPYHYIPLHGSAHGIFFDPATKMFVGDGPPRENLRRFDGSLPCTTKARLAREPTSAHADDAEDSLHIQTKALHQAIDYGADVRAANAPPVPSSVPGVPGPTPTIGSLSTRAFEKKYYCICTNKWESHRHSCPAPCNVVFPPGGPTRPGTVLPPGWFEFRLQVDASIYPNSVVPEPGSAAARTTSAVGGRFGDDLPARWFAPGPVGFVFDFGQEEGEIDVSNVPALIAAADAHEAGLRGSVWNKGGKRGGKKKKTKKGSAQTEGTSAFPATASAADISNWVSANVAEYVPEPRGIPVNTHGAGAPPVGMSAKAAGKMPEPRGMPEHTHDAVAPHVGMSANAGGKMPEHAQNAGASPEKAVAFSKAKDAGVIPSAGEKEDSLGAENGVGGGAADAGTDGSARKSAETDIPAKKYASGGVAGAGTSAETDTSIKKKRRSGHRRGVKSSKRGKDGVARQGNNQKT